MSILENLITKAQIHGALVHVVLGFGGEIAVVQTLGLRKMTEWPLPANQATARLQTILGSRT